MCLERSFALSKSLGIVARSRGVVLAFAPGSGACFCGKGSGGGACNAGAVMWRRLPAVALGMHVEVGSGSLTFETDEREDHEE